MQANNMQSTNMKPINMQANNMQANNMQANNMKPTNMKPTNMQSNNSQPVIPRIYKQPPAASLKKTLNVISATNTMKPKIPKSYIPQPEGIIEYDDNNKLIIAKDSEGQSIIEFKNGMPVYATFNTTKKHVAAKHKGKVSNKKTAKANKRLIERVGKLNTFGKTSLKNINKLNSKTKKISIKKNKKKLRDNVIKKKENLKRKIAKKIKSKNKK